jgi:FdhD protein
MVIPLKRVDRTGKDPEGRPTRASTTRRRVAQVQKETTQGRDDVLAVEEPLEIRLGPSGEDFVPVSVTMRTPGHDFELAAGFLLTEGILTDPEQIRSISYCTDPAVDGEQQYNIVNIALRPGVPFDRERLRRNFYTTSSCGVCGKASIEAIHVRGIGPIVDDGFTVDAGVFPRLEEALRHSQSLFEKTGGLHASGLFDGEGRLLAIREDVGRHNAVDKLVGAAFLERKLPLRGRILMVSGRASFEIMQKAAAAGIPIVAAVSAPSSLACDVARAFGMTLVGFVRGSRFNIYAAPHRILVGGHSAPAGG